MVCCLELMTSFLLCFSTVLIFKILNPCWSMEHHSKWGVEPVLWSLAPYLWGLDLLHGGMVRHTSSYCFFFFFLLTTPKNEDLALAVHVSISIPANLQVIACFGSLWWDTLVFFEFILSLFVDLGGLPGLP